MTTYLSLETYPRPTFRSTLTQPSQMGNFKHQSLRGNDREKERDRERDGEKDRERDIRDKEGQERLRHVGAFSPVVPSFLIMIWQIAFR